MEQSTTPCHRPLWLPIVIAIILGGSFIIGKKIEIRSTPTIISVSGEGKVSAIPDVAWLSFGVQTGRMKTAEAAMEQLGKKMKAAISAAKEAGIKEKDINTEYLNLRPAYDWNEGRQIPKGFEASQSLRVKIRDLEKVGEILSAVTAAGANQAGGVSFAIDDREELLQEAREEAINDAKKKARILALDLGVSLGKLSGFNEGGRGYPSPVFDMVRMESGARGIGGGAPVPIPAGEQEILVNVTLMYEVE